VKKFSFGYNPTEPTNPDRSKESPSAPTHGEPRRSVTANHCLPRHFNYFSYSWQLADQTIRNNSMRHLIWFYYTILARSIKELSRYCVINNDRVSSIDRRIYRASLCVPLSQLSIDRGSIKGFSSSFCDALSQLRTSINRLRLFDTR